MSMEAAPKEGTTPQRWSPVEQSLFESRIIQVSGQVDSDMADRVIKQLLAMETADASAPVYLYINSPGGEVTSGFAIYDTARFIKPEVITVVTGLAASMGSLIALCADKKNRLAFPNSRFLIHQPLISGHLRGTATDIDIHAKDIVALKEKINRLYAAETGRTYEEIKKATDRDKWLDAQEALDYGLISKIISKRSELPKK
jgi:ATP-dependent Clp protease protease subunit